MAGSERVARFVVRRRGAVAAAWLVTAVLLVPAASRLERSLTVAARVPRSESAAVDSILASRFRSPFAYSAILVATGVPSPRTDSGRDALRTVVASLARAHGVARTLSYLDAPDTLFLAASGDATFVVVGLEPGENGVDALLPGLRRASGEAQWALWPSHPRAALRWTGEMPLNADVRRASGDEVRLAERRVLPLTLALLVIGFGAVTAALVAVASGALAIALALGAAALIASLWPLSMLVQNVVTMLGLGLGIDYALLVVSRFREALARGTTAPEAAVEAGAMAGHTVALSGLTVAIGFAALLVVPLDELRSIAIGGLLVTVCAVLIAVTLLPPLLATLGSRIDAGRVRPVLRRRAAAAGWRRWARFVARRPGLVLAVAGIPMLVLAGQSIRLDTSLPRGDWLPRDVESAHALRDLHATGRAGIVQTVRVMLEMPAGGSALRMDGWRATSRLAEHIAADDRVARVRSLPAVAGSAVPSPLAVAAMPAGVRRTLVTDDGALALIEILPREGLGASELGALVRELRAMDAASIAALAGVRLRVGGLPAFNLDYAEATLGRTLPVIAIVVGVSFLVLAIALRSILIPLKAVALNLLAVAGAFGAMVLVFQDGYASSLVGLAGATGGVFPAVPLLVFCTVFGLSMDYEIFLVRRLAEAHHAGLDEATALETALARTGGVITSAAVVMIVVFGAFVIGDFLLVKMLGFALAVAVLLDATIIRLAIAPALLRLAGRWNWWPGERVRGRGRDHGTWTERVDARRGLAHGDARVAPPAVPRA